MDCTSFKIKIVAQRKNPILAMFFSTTVRYKPMGIMFNLAYLK